MRSLVTGVAGFIGSHIAEELIRLGHTVVGIDDFSGGFRDNIPQEVTTIHGDVVNTWTVRELFEYSPFDHVFHCAAYAAEGLSHFIRRYNYANNLIGSVNLINAAVNQQPMVKRFVFLSSIAVYGDAQPPFCEADIPRPIDPYGIAKWAVEMDLAAASRMFGLDFTIFRLHNVYGERQNIGDYYRNVVGIFMNHILQGVPLPIFGDGQQIRAFTYIGDVAPVIAASAEDRRAANETFNLGSDDTYGINVLAGRVAYAMTGSVDHEREYLPQREEAVRAFCDHTKAKVLLGAPCVTKLDDGLARMATWVKQCGARQSKPFEGIEVERNLPPSWRKVIA
jgi:UDP-glucose 4-epimerase